MALGSGPGASGHVRGRRRAKKRPLSEINVTPLVDVMLVLLIIFMITAPLMTHKIKVEPQKTPQPQINVRGDQTTKYRIVQEVVQTAQSQGMRKVGFVATPQRP